MKSSVSSNDLPNLFKINENLYRGGQPTEAGIDELKRLGIRTVINLRSETERTRKEEDRVRSAGLRFLNIPLNNWLGPKDDTIDRIVAALNRSDNHPVFVHCNRGADRTGTVIAVYRMTFDGWTADQANNEAEQFGFGWWQIWMKDYVNDYYRRRIKVVKR